jgi:CLIP-associating protein 1/2
MHASLRVFYADAPPSPESEEVKAATFAFGLMALGKYILRLPAEIAEEELPRLKSTLISVCTLLSYHILLSLISLFYSGIGVK